MMYLKQIICGTPEHDEMIRLRNKILREPFGIRFTEEEMAREPHDILLGCYLSEGENLIGCCVLSTVGEKIFQLRQMAVKEPYQKKGIGKEILSFAEQVTKEKQFDAIILHAREWAVDFYRKAGYTIISDEFIEVGIPHYEMQKKIASNS